MLSLVSFVCYPVRPSKIKSEFSATLPNSGLVSFNSTFQPAPHVQSCLYMGGRDFLLLEFLIQDHITAGKKQEEWRHFAEHWLGGGADLRGRRCRSRREGKGDLISTLLGLKEWVWSGGEKRPTKKKKRTT